MTKIYVIITLLNILTVNSDARAQTNHEEGYLDGYMIGITFRQLEADEFLIADIPFIEARVPLGTNILQFKYGGHLMWGLTNFFVEWNYAAGILVYPFGQFFGINATSRLGSFFFDNISYMGAVGVNLDVPFSKNNFISLGVEYFYRNSRNLFDFISFGNEREESINLDSCGIGVCIGLRF